MKDGYLKNILRAGLTTNFSKAYQSTPQRMPPDLIHSPQSDQDIITPKKIILPNKLDFANNVNYTTNNEKSSILVDRNVAEDQTDNQNNILKENNPIEDKVWTEISIKDHNINLKNKNDLAEDTKKILSIDQTNRIPKIEVLNQNLQPEVPFIKNISQATIPNNEAVPPRKREELPKVELLNQNLQPDSTSTKVAPKTQISNNQIEPINSDEKQPKVEALNQKMQPGSPSTKTIFQTINPDNLAGAQTSQSTGPNHDKVTKPLQSEIQTNQIHELEYKFISPKPSTGINKKVKESEIFTEKTQVIQQPIDHPSFNFPIIKDSLKSNDEQIKKIAHDITSIARELQEHIQKEERKPLKQPTLPKIPMSHNLGGWTDLERNYIR